MNVPKPKKLTLSCSRCRVSKLKCDRKEPCLECVNRDCAHLCTKDERQPRAKRAKPQSTESISQKSHENDEPDVEEAAQILEHFVDEIPLPVRSAGVAPDMPNRYWETQDPQRDDQKRDLVQDIIKALPEWDVIQTIYDVFVTRCQGPLGNVTHVPSFLNQVDQLGHCLKMTSPEVSVGIMLSMDTLACLLLALSLGLAFYPSASLVGFQPTPLSCRVEDLRSSHEPTETWRSLAVRCLQGKISLFCGSISSLQAAIMLLLDTKDPSLELDAVLVTAIAGARKLGLHRLGNAPLNASLPLDFTAEPPQIRTEVGIRIWWTLVMRDWSRGQSLGYYTVHPSHFNTRMPLHLNDDDLLPASFGKIPERPLSEFTTLSYTLHALKLSLIVRKSIDLDEGVERANKAVQRRHNIDQMYEKYVANLPSHFRLGSTVGLSATGPMAAIPVQRFMLHQQLWSLLLRLHRSNISSPMGRASCQQLGYQIISSQAQIQTRCTFCSSLSTNEIQLFSAATVLVLGLLFDCLSIQEDCSSAQLSRLMTQDRIREAVELLRNKIPPSRSAEDAMSLDPHGNSASRSVAALEALLTLEKSLSDNSSLHMGAESKHSLYSQVVEILKTLDSPATPSCSLVPTPWTPGGTGFPDLDVMPILSNGFIPNVWDFLDFSLSTDEGKEEVIPMGGDFDGVMHFNDPLHASQTCSNAKQDDLDLTSMTQPSNLTGDLFINEPDLDFIRRM